MAFIRIAMGPEQQPLVFMPEVIGDDSLFGFFRPKLWKPKPIFEPTEGLLPPAALVRFAVQTAGSPLLWNAHPRWSLPIWLLKGHDTGIGKRAREMKANLDQLRKFYGSTLPAQERSYLRDGCTLNIGNVLLTREGTEAQPMWKFSKRTFPLLTAAQFAHCILRDLFTYETLAKYHVDFLHHPTLEYFTEGKLRLARDKTDDTELTPVQELAATLGELAAALDELVAAKAPLKSDTKALADFLPLALSQLNPDNKAAAHVESKRDLCAVLGLVHCSLAVENRIESGGEDVRLVFDLLRLAAAELQAAGVTPGQMRFSARSVGQVPPEVPPELILVERPIRRSKKDADDEQDQTPEKQLEEKRTLYGRVQALESQVATLLKRIAALEKKK